MARVLREITIIIIITTALPATVTATNHAGYLYTDGWSGSDWYSPGGGFDLPICRLYSYGKTAKISSRFRWHGYGQISQSETAGVAFTQQQMSTGWLNSNTQPGPQQAYWKRGIGAFVGPEGLGLQVWQVETRDTVYWTQSALCGKYAHKGGNPGLCICAAAGTSCRSYITSVRDFNLERGTHYEVRLKLTGEGNGAVRLQAELRDRTRVVQRAQIYFQMKKVFPTGEKLKGTAFRTPGSPNKLVRVSMVDTF